MHTSSVYLSQLISQPSIQILAFLHYKSSAQTILDYWQLFLTSFCLHHLPGTLYLYTFVLSTSYQPLDVNRNPISSSPLSPSTVILWWQPQIRFTILALYRFVYVCTSFNEIQSLTKKGSEQTFSSILLQIALRFSNRQIEVNARDFRAAPRLCRQRHHLLETSI